MQPTIRVELAGMVLAEGPLHRRPGYLRRELRQTQELEPRATANLRAEILRRARVLLQALR